MDDYEIEQYMISKEKFTIPEIQQQFHLEYGEVRRYFYDLQETREIILKEGQFYYNFKNEEIFDLYRTMLWECVRDRSYNKFKLRCEYRLDAEDISGFEAWLRIHNYYDFISDKILITREEFIKRFGKIEEVDEKDSTFEDIVEEIRKLELDKNGLEGKETKEELETDDEEEEKDLEQEEEKSDNDMTEIMSTLQEEDTVLKTCDDLMRELLEGHSIKTKADFLSLAEQRLTIDEQKMPAFRDTLESVIEDVKKMTEIEFKSYLVRLLKK